MKKFPTLKSLAVFAVLPFAFSAALSTAQAEPSDDATGTATVAPAQQGVVAWNWSEPDADGTISFEAKAGGEFRTQFDGREEGVTYLFEIVRDGKWETLQYKPQDQPGPVFFGVPSDVPSGKYEMRIVNTTTQKIEDAGKYMVKVTADEQPAKDKPAPDKPTPDKPAPAKPSLPKTGV